MTAAALSAREQEALLMAWLRGSHDWVDAEDVYRELATLGATPGQGRSSLSRLRLQGRIEGRNNPDESKRNRFGGPARQFRATEDGAR